ncbi:MAG: 1,4-dihydroxy-2-naphthoate polyprenyltransferase [Anaerolineales bacterium]|nr:1,4-dihydroxy-2-naphthoate polyprenyltransferase [Anaerolineales bacterium]
MKPGSMAVWLEAARPRTLVLAFACIILGAFLAAAAGAFSWPLLILSLLTATCLQILSNLANDYGDSVHGADHKERSGPQRAVQSGAIAAGTMKQAIATTAGLAVVFGLALILLAFGLAGLWLVLIFALLGAAAIWAAIAYTASSRPYGYVGLGDLFVLIFFGWVGVAGSYFLHTAALSGAILLPATSCGLLAVAVLNVNNIRDIESDRKAGKQSIPVRLGRERARLYHWMLLAGAVLGAIVYVLLQPGNAWEWLFLLATPLLLRNGLAVTRGETAAELDPYLKQMSLSTLAFVILLGLGQLLS